MTVNMLCIRDPDYTNEYVADADINTITIDFGSQWSSYKHFAGALQDSEAEALEFERHILGEVAHLAPDNPVRVAAGNFFAEARAYS